VHDGGYHPQGNGRKPDGILISSGIKNTAAQPNPQKNAHKMTQKNEAKQQREIAHTKKMGDGATR
jgi:hypothetical protein